MNDAVIFYNALAFSIVVAGLYSLWRLTPRRLMSSVVSLAIALAAITLFGAFLSKVDGFGKIQLFTWAFFVHYPLFLIGVGSISFRRNRALFCLCTLLVICIMLVGVDAFLLEPHWVEVSRVTIPSGKLQDRVRVAVVADLQTDRPQQYEQRVFALVAAENPDLILLAGDYLHISNNVDYIAAKAELNALMLEARLEAPLGTYAVRGNVDWDDWDELFAGLPVVAINTTTSQDLGPVVLTGLSLEDSGNTRITVPAQDKFHIVLGHRPDFSLGQVNSDLLIAGHTHGGQVRIPFLGPMFTLS